CRALYSSSAPSSVLNQVRNRLSLYCAIPLTYSILTEITSRRLGVCSAPRQGVFPDARFAGVK
ncbi:MAG: hypothetical protein LBG87_08530, partial [Spirochaetaceae bacterium]|nr:hypothetical protein [Spirochaetaceae bacterium]